MVIFKTPQFPFEKKQNAPSLAHSTVQLFLALPQLLLFCFIFQIIRKI